MSIPERKAALRRTMLDALKRVFPAMWRADPVLVAKEGLK